jgi:hypothetical protein
VPAPQDRLIIELPGLDYLKARGYTTFEKEESDGPITRGVLKMNQERRLALYREMEERRKLRAKRPVAEKLAITERLRDLQKALAPARAAHKVKRANEAVEIKIKTR